MVSFRAPLALFALLVGLTSCSSPAGESTPAATARSTADTPPQFALTGLPAEYVEDAKPKAASLRNTEPLGFCRGLPAAQRFGTPLSNQRFDGAGSGDWLQVSVYRTADQQLFNGLSTAIRTCKPQTDTSVSSSIVLMVRDVATAVSGPAIGDSSLWWQTQTTITDSTGYMDGRPSTPKPAVVVQSDDYVVVALSGPGLKPAQLAQFVRSGLRG